MRAHGCRCAVEDAGDGVVVEVLVVAQGQHRALPRRQRRDLAPHRVPLGDAGVHFPVKVAVARTVGWISQWNEMIEDPDQKIGRPRQLFTGADKREYIPMGKRK